MNRPYGLRFLPALAVALALLGTSAHAAISTIRPTLGLIDGMSAAGVPARQLELHVAIELMPKDNQLETLAAAIEDPASPLHRTTLSAEAFAARFGRPLAESQALAALFTASGAAEVYVSHDGLVIGGVFTVAQAEKTFATKFAEYKRGDRIAVAPTEALRVPIGNVRAVRGVVAATSPRLADVRPSFTLFRGEWYLPTRFREIYDAVPDGGAGQHIALIEDASDRLNLARDLPPFLSGEGAPNASANRVSEHVFTPKAQTMSCGRDDRGQEPALDVDAALTMAPQAEIELRYDNVCGLGNDGTVALARALDENPTQIVFPFTLGPVYDRAAELWGPTPLPFLEAVVRGISIVVPSGDDGALGFALSGIERTAVAYPCMLASVICAGGTQVGDRDSYIDEAPWNDGLNASGGGISGEPRPVWQSAPSSFEFSPQFVPAQYRIVPDVSADASGHLRGFWHGYAFGGVGGTSESAAIVAAQLAAINAAVDPAKRLISAGDLYVLARLHPEAYRQVTRENDRGYVDNTIRPPKKPLPIGFKGALPPPVVGLAGCKGVQPGGCSVRPGYNAVTGLGSLKEKAAIAALR